MSDRGYQYGYSDISAEMHSIEGRRRKAITMVAVLGDSLGDRLGHARLLNVGCSAGIIDECLAPHVKHVTGIDIDAPAIEAARLRCKVNNAEFRTGDAMNLDFPDGSFEIVVCSQVYEHVPDPAKMMDEIYRVLVPGGICYFAATNRFCVMEQHYHLPFLSVMPVSMAHWYLRLLGKGRYYYERHKGLGELRGLVRRFDVDDYTRKFLSDPGAFEASYMFNSRVKLEVARALARFAYPIFPGYVWLLRRP
jgi:2-polyprenyl-3-methyl-5-hydroxy-6-metoxy-1,4-benzoquinol methylase